MDKIAISYELFKKKVEIEAQNLMYFEYMKEHEAFAKARKEVSDKYIVA